MQVVPRFFQLLCYGMASAMPAIFLAGEAHAADIKADVSCARSGTDPHPTTYAWKGDVAPITEPGPFFYTWYYTGTVDADARVDSEGQINRIPVSLNECVC